MAPDIYTKAFSNKEKRKQACELVNVMGPANLVDVIQRRAKIFESLKNDQKWHPINKEPQSGNSATHRKWVEGQTQWLASANLAMNGSQAEWCEVNCTTDMEKTLVLDPIDTMVQIPALVDFCHWLKQYEMDAN